jgi:protocatechuate 3,4-dioxygenase beta subunit
MLSKFVSLLVASCALGAIAHDLTVDEIAANEVHVLKGRDELRACKRSFLENKELHAYRLKKREELVANFVAKRGIQRRNPTPYTERGITARSLYEEVSCVLTPQADIGPYFVKSTIREDNREGQPGIPMLLDVQFVDTANCNPITDAYIDIWSANATGVYSGISAKVSIGQPATDGLTFLRGLQPLDSKGLYHSTTIFPGWYAGRATHTHVMVHRGGKVSADGKTYSGGKIPHIGQFFWDMNLIYQIKNIAPYTKNTYTLLENNRDFIFMQANTGYNALMKTELIGQTLADGLLATITIGIRPDNHNPATGNGPNPTLK